MSNFFNHKLRGRSPGEIAGIVIFGIIAITGLAILFGFVIMWLWNWLMPELFGLPLITYWQGVGLFILLKILLGGCGGGGGKSSNKCDENRKRNGKSSFSKWKYYDKFWKEEGDQLYQDFIKRQEASNNQDVSEEE